MSFILFLSSLNDVRLVREDLQGEILVFFPPTGVKVYLLVFLDI